MANNMNDVVQLLKYIKSLKGDYNDFAKHTNSRDIETITICCANLLQDNIPLPISKKKSIKLLLSPIEKDIKTISNRKSSLNEVHSKPRSPSMFAPGFVPHIWSMDVSTHQRCRFEV